MIGVPAKRHRRHRLAASVTSAAICMCMAAVCLFDDGSNTSNTSDLAVSSSSSLLYTRVSRNLLQSIVTKGVALEEKPPPFVPSLEDLSYCASNNDVPMRGDKFDTVDNKFAEDVQNQGRRIYSLQYDDFVPRHSRQCKTVQEMTDAIKNGRRVWDPSIKPDQISSTRQIQQIGRASCRER